MVRNDPVLSEAVPKMLNISAQISVRNRKYVLENGSDVMNSSDEDAPNQEHGEDLTGMYIGGLKAPVVLSQSEVARQKATVHALKSHGFWVDSDAPDPSSTTSDFPQSAPSSPANTRCASRFDDPETLKSQRVPRAKTPTGEAPSKPTVSTAVSTPPPQKVSKRQTFLSDSSAVSEDELPPIKRTRQ
jgi:hypothetical protein